MNSKEQYIFQTKSIHQQYDDENAVRTAFHEVGHVLMYLLIGARFSKVTIEKSINHDGIVNHDYYGKNVHSKIVDDYLCQNLAGLLFEWMEYGDESWVYADGTEFYDLDYLLEIIFPDFDIDDPVIRSAEADLREIARTLKFFYPDPNILRKTVEKMKRRTLRRLIQNFNSGVLLVEELLKRRSMTYEEVVAFLVLKSSELMPHLQTAKPGKVSPPTKSNKYVADNLIRYNKDSEVILALEAIAHFKG